VGREHGESAVPEATVPLGPVRVYFTLCIWK
jgi:hypothetical protein